MPFIYPCNDGNQDINFDELIEAIKALLIDSYCKYQPNGELPDMPTNTKVSLRLSTDTAGTSIFEPFYDDPNTGIDSNLTNLFGSDTGLNGYKLITIDAFEMGKEYELGVNIPDKSQFAEGTTIEFRWINLFTLAELFLRVAGDVINPEFNAIPGEAISKVGIFESEFALSLSGNSGTLTIKPNMANWIGMIKARRADNLYMDTAIIGAHEKSTNPLELGAITLLGF